MRRFVTTKKGHILIICLILLAIASSLPIGTSGKVLGALFWFIAAELFLMMGMTRSKVLVKPILIFTLLFVLSFFIPVEIVMARGPVGISWMRCKVVGTRTYYAHPEPREKNTHLISHGCNPIFGVEPVRVVKISIPETK